MPNLSVVLGINAAKNLIFGWDSEIHRHFVHQNDTPDDVFSTVSKESGLYDSPT